LVAGLLGGIVGGLLLAAAPGSSAPLAVLPVLAVIGAGCGAVGGAAIGAGMSIAEAVARSQRTVALIVGAAIAGGVAGAAIQWLGRESLLALVGVRVETGGGLEGLVVGATVGLGLRARHIRRRGVGWPAPRGRGPRAGCGSHRSRVRARRAGIVGLRPAAGRRDDSRHRPGVTGIAAALTPLGPESSASPTSVRSRAH
jgi:hypothetical protein